MGSTFGFGWQEIGTASFPICVSFLKDRKNRPGKLEYYRNPHDLAFSKEK